MRIHRAGGSAEEICCPRCAMRFQQGRRDVKGVELGDFQTGERIDAREAFFVENNSVAFAVKVE